MHFPGEASSVNLTRSRKAENLTRTLLLIRAKRCTVGLRLLCKNLQFDYRILRRSHDNCSLSGNSFSLEIYGVFLQEMKPFFCRQLKGLWALGTALRKKREMSLPLLLLHTRFYLGKNSVKEIKLAFLQGIYSHLVRLLWNLQASSLEKLYVLLCTWEPF